MFNTGQPIVTLTDTAAMHVKRLIEQGDTDVIGLRVGVKTAGCSGMQYDVQYATERTNNQVNKVLRKKEHFLCSSKLLTTTLHSILFHHLP